MTEQTSSEIHERDQVGAETGVQDKSVRPTKTAEPTTVPSTPESMTVRRRDVVSRLWFRLADDAEPSGNLNPIVVDRLIGTLARQQQARWLSHFEEQGPGALIPQDYESALEFVRSAPEALSPARARQLLPQLSETIVRFDRQGRTHEEIADFVTEGSRIAEDVAARGELATATFGYLREDGITGPGSALTWGVQADIMGMTLDPRLQALSTVAYFEQVRAAHQHLIDRDPFPIHEDGEALIRRTVFNALNNSVIHLTELPGVDAKMIDLVATTSIFGLASHLLATAENTEDDDETVAIVDRVLGTNAASAGRAGDVMTIVEVMSGAPLALGLVCGDRTAAAVSAAGGCTMALIGDHEKAAGRFFNGGIALLRANRAALPDVDSSLVSLETAFYGCSLMWGIIGGDTDVVRPGAINSAAFNLTLQIEEDEHMLTDEHARAVLVHLRTIAAAQDPRQLGRVHQSLDFVDPDSDEPDIELIPALVGLIMRALEATGFEPDRTEHDPFTASFALALVAASGVDVAAIARYVERILATRAEGVDVTSILAAVLDGSSDGTLLEEVRLEAMSDESSIDPSDEGRVDIATAIGSGIRDAIGASGPADAWREAQQLLRPRSITELTQAVDAFVASVR